MPLCSAVVTPRLKAYAKSRPSARLWRPSKWPDTITMSPPKLRKPEEMAQSVAECVATFVAGFVVTTAGPVALGLLKVLRASASLVRWCWLLFAIPHAQTFGFCCFREGLV